jgi:phosphatidylethanolamine/phosphatidyl-N-methylethanolamine N-methyltransferase
MIQPLLGRVSHTAQFIAEAVNNPRDIGAVIPSSRNLAAAMARWLPRDPRARILELGPGTGSVTDALLRQGVRPDRLIAVEKSPKLAQLLQRKHPFLRVVEGDALDLVRVLAVADPDPQPYAVVFSSLPLLNFPPEEGRSLAGQIRDILQPGGLLVQYSYSLVSRRESRLFCFRRIGSEVIWFNVPPARVSVYTR